MRNILLVRKNARKKKKHKTGRKTREQIVKVVDIKPNVSGKELNTPIKCKSGKYWEIKDIWGMDKILHLKDKDFLD